MTASNELNLLIETGKLVLVLCLPLLVGVFLIGLGSGTAQATTTVQDPSISTVPRLIVGGAVILLSSSWMMGRLVEFSLALLSDLGRFVH